MRKYLIFGLILIFSMSCNAQTEQIQNAPKIEWMSFEQAVARNDKQPKKIFIDAYTEWCGWCKKMDASTFKDSTIVAYMSEKYYAVKLDAECKDTIRFKDQIFIYKPEYKANELALTLLKGKMSYPSFLFMDGNYQLLAPLPGFQSPDNLLRVLKYFGEDIHLKMTWEEYLKQP